MPDRWPVRVSPYSEGDLDGIPQAREEVIEGEGTEEAVPVRQDGDAPQHCIDVPNHEPHIREVAAAGGTGRREPPNEALDSNDGQRSTEGDQHREDAKHEHGAQLPPLGHVGAL
jgi:hypothetical protein